MIQRWLAVALLCTAGCSRDTAREVVPDADREAFFEPSVTPRDVRQEPTPDTCRAYLQELNARVEPVTISPELERLWSEDLRLRPDEIAEVRRPEFTSLDGHHLADALLFADAVRGLGVGGLTPAEQAREAMAWVRRNVYLTSRDVPPVPAKYVALRGSGDVLERAYVYLALLEQLGIPGCLVGPDGLADREAGPSAEDGTGSPFRAVGALVDGSVAMFNPASGEEWEPTEGGAVTLYLCPTLTSLAPRMARLEEREEKTLRVRVATDPVALREKFAATGAGVRFWNPPTEPGTPTRATRQFLPAQEGGVASEDPGASPQARYQLGLIPAEFYPSVFNRLDGASRSLVFSEFASPFVATVMNPDGPADRAIRGEFTDAVRMLTEIRERARQELRHTPIIDTAVVGRWCDEVNQAMAQRSRARRDGQSADLERADRRLSSLMAHLRRRPGEELPPAYSEQDASDRELGKAAAELLKTNQAAAGSLRATFRLAVCMQEQAEWQTLRARTARQTDRPSREREARSAWRNAADWWGQYVSQFGRDEGLFPDRAAHARAMLERARAMAAAPA